MNFRVDVTQKKQTKLGTLRHCFITKMIDYICGLGRLDASFDHICNNALLENLLF